MQLSFILVSLQVKMFFLTSCDIFGSCGKHCLLIIKYRCNFVLSKKYRHFVCVCASLFSVLAAASAMYQSDFLHLKFHATQGWLSMQHSKSEVAYYTLKHSSHGDFPDSHLVTIIPYSSLRKHDQYCLWKRPTANMQRQLAEWFGHFPNMWKVPSLRLGEDKSSSALSRTA